MYLYTRIYLIICVLYVYIDMRVYIRVRIFVFVCVFGVLYVARLFDVILDLFLISSCVICSVVVFEINLRFVFLVEGVVNFYRFFLYVLFLIFYFSRFIFYKVVGENF